jgi:hypothetical protein
MKVSIKTTALISIIWLVFAMPSFSQNVNCTAYFDMTNIMNIERDGTNNFPHPLYFTNYDCKVGGLEVDIKTDPFGALEPIGIDTVGCRIAGWEYLNISRDEQNELLRIVALADWPNQIETPPMDTGSGILFNIIFRFGCDYLEDTLVDVYLDTAIVSDSSGYNLFNNVVINNCTIFVGEEVNPVLRGDANCDGLRIGSDVTYMVAYFRNIVDCPCSRCAGDANGDGSIIGSDVTYFVRWLGGMGPEPSPCGQ